MFICTSSSCTDPRLASSVLPSAAIAAAPGVRSARATAERRSARAAMISALASCTAVSFS
jgi:hypothetical protein